MNNKGMNKLLLLVALVTSMVVPAYGQVVYDTPTAWFFGTTCPTLWVPSNTESVAASESRHVRAETAEWWTTNRVVPGGTAERMDGQRCHTTDGAHDGARKWNGRLAPSGTVRAGPMHMASSRWDAITRRISMRPYRYAGAPPRRRPIDENKLVRDLHRVCRYVLGKHPVKHAPPSRVRYAAQMVLRYGSPGELTAILGWLARAPRRLPVRVGASAWAMGETGEPFEYLLRHLDRFTERLRAEALAA